MQETSRLSQNDLPADAAFSLAAELKLLAVLGVLPRIVLQMSDGQMQSSRKRDAQEAVNICHRLLLSMQPVKDKDEVLPLLPRNLKEVDETEAKMKMELMEKMFCRDAGSAARVAAVMMQTLEDAKTRIRESRDSPPDVTVSFAEDAVASIGQVRVSSAACADFVSPACARVRWLTRKFGLLPTARMLVRYEGLGSGSQQWGDAVTVHKQLHAFAGVRTEGFASPLNSKMLGLPDSAFCSCFWRDVDAPFGSVGDFFDVDFASRPGGWTANPPFIETVMNRVADKVIGHLDRNPDTNWFFLTFPDWRDNPGWAALDSSKFKTDRIDMTPGRFVMQNCYGEPLTPKNRITIFVMGSLPSAECVARVRECFLSNQIDPVLREWQQRCHV